MSEILHLPLLPDFDPLYVAELKQTRIDWLRSCGNNYVLNPGMVIEGEGLGSIIHDDPNAFGLFYMPENAALAQNAIGRVMEIRIGTRELPEKVRQQLDAVKNEICAAPWRGEDDYKGAKSHYEVHAATFTERFIDENPQSKEAVKYASSCLSNLTEPWFAFLDETKI